MHHLAPLAYLLLAAPSALAQSCIDFDGLDCEAGVTNQIPGATFSSTQGQQVVTSCIFDLGTSLPAYICTADIFGNLNCSSPIFVDFPSPVNNLTFLACGDDTVGVTGLVDVFGSTGLLGTAQIVTDGDFTGPDLVDLSMFLDVTRIEISNITNGSGLAFDDFCMEFSNDCPTTIYCDEGQNPGNVADISILACDLTPGTTVDMAGGPAGATTYLLIGDGNNIPFEPPGSVGDLCVGGGGCLGRYVSDVGVISAAGQYSTDISSSLSGGPNFGIPTCGGSIQAGETWYFQYWHRQLGGQPGSFSSAIGVTFQ